MSATQHASEYSEDEVVQPSTSHHSKASKNKTHSHSTSTNKTSKKRKVTIAPAPPRQYSSYELFGTDSEDDDDHIKCSQDAVPVPQKSKIAEPEPKKMKSSKRPPTSSAGRESSSKASAKDVFGSDSDDDIFQNSKPGKTPAKICSYLTKRVAQGVSRQTDSNKDGSHYIELKVYKCDEIRNVQPMNRWRHAIITIKNQCNTDTEAWTTLTEFIRATRQEFKHCRPDIISGCASNSF